MPIKNFTPFEHFDSIASNSEGEFFRFCVVKATFQITNGGLLLTEQQVRPNMEDVYVQDPKSSSLAQENDLAPYKPNGEVVFINPVSRCSNAEPQATWNASGVVGPIRFNLRITGEREFIRGWGAWKLTTPVPCREVQLNFEQAWGGKAKTSDDFCDANPVGKGYEALVDSSCNRAPAPQIECAQNPVSSPDNSNVPIALCPVSRAWLPRRTFAGTYDQEWKEKKWPFSPDDFSDQFHSCSPAMLQRSGFWNGDEGIHLQNIGRRPEYRFKLNETRRPTLLLMGENDSVYVADFNCDTIVLDLENDSVSMVWRSSFSTPHPTTYEKLVLAE